MSFIFTLHCQWLMEFLSTIFGVLFWYDNTLRSKCSRTEQLGVEIKQYRINFFENIHCQYIISKLMPKENMSRYYGNINADKVVLAAKRERYNSLISSLKLLYGEYQIYS